MHRSSIRTQPKKDKKKLRKDRRWMKDWHKKSDKIKSRDNAI